MDDDWGYPYDSGNPHIEKHILFAYIWEMTIYWPAVSVAQPQMYLHTD